jgi:hypothetical protein
MLLVNLSCNALRVSLTNTLEAGSGEAVLVAKSDGASRPHLSAHAAISPVPVVTTKTSSRKRVLPVVIPSSEREVLQQRVAQLMQSLCPTFVPSSTQSFVQNVVNEAYEYMSHVFEKSEAVAWADSFELPKDVHERDEKLLVQSGNNFPVMIGAIQDELRQDRFSEERVRAVVPASDPDFNYLLELAKGMTVSVPPSFECCSAPRPLRQLYSELAAPINKLLWKQWTQRKTVILRTSVAAEIPGVHYSPIHWTPSREKAEGRPLMDLSDKKDGHSLNSLWLREWGQENIGRIRNPTIRELVVMICEFARAAFLADPSITWKDIVLCKMDLKSAFNLLWFRPEDVRYFAAALTDDLTMLSLVGVFGYTNLPAFFDHIPKVLLRLLRPIIPGAANMFVDDFMGICLRRNWEELRGLVTSVCQALLGPTAIADEKTKVGHLLDWIGWELDLILQRVSIAHHCFLKAVYLYFEVDTSQKIPLRQLQQLGSLASRYGEVCEVMRPYSAAIWSCTRGITNPSTRCVLTPMAIRSIWLWRCTLCLHRWDRLEFARSFSSFEVPPVARFYLSFDASLSGVGGVIEEDTSSGFVTWGFLRQHFPAEFNLDRSDYQNAAEFLAILALLLQLVRGGVTDCAIALKGDSKVALAWAASQKCNGLDRNNTASLLFTLVCMRFRYTIVSTTWLSSGDNHLCDALSRFSDMSSYGSDYITASNYYDWTESCPTFQLWARCNPRWHDQGDFEAFLSAWVYLQDRLVLCDLYNTHPLLPPYHTAHFHPR